MICYTNKHKIPFQVDDSDAEAVSYFAWHIHDTYIATSQSRACEAGVKKIPLFLHQFLLGRAPAGLFWDHRNRDKMDNHRDNLRLATRKVNGRNRGLLVNNTSGVSGVSWHKTKKMWCVSISDDGFTSHLGYFDTLEEATSVRKSAEDRWWGEDR